MPQTLALLLDLGDPIHRKVNNRRLLLLPRDLRQYSNRKVFITLGAITGLAFATTVATTLALSALMLYRQGAQNYNNNRIQLESLMSGLYRAASLERQYILTHNPAELAAYRQLASQIPHRLESAEKAAVPASLTSEMERLRPLITQVRDEQDRLMALAESGNTPAALAALETGAEAQLTSQTAALVAVIQDGDVTQLTLERARITTLAQLARNITLSSLALTLLLAVLVYWLYLKAIKAERMLDKAKDEFVSLASHQLRTPATGVKTILATLSSGDIGPLNPRQAYFLRRATESNDRGLQIIEDLLNVAKADAGRLVLNATTFNLDELLGAIVAEQKAAIEAKHITLRIKQPDLPVTITADRDKLYMAIGNLLDNARKYTPESGTITLSLSAKPHQFRVTVADTGVGIAPADISHIFDRFQRTGEAEKDHVEGTGLGLYLVRSVVELHGGSIKATSRRDHGSKFVMIIPQRKKKS
jgi:signal transduction histidine kinase